MLLAAAAGIVLKNNLERIGPLALALLMAAAAAACYAWVWVRRNRASLVDDYILLLGALLLSGDIAFIERQFHLLGDAWHRHFLVLAIVHGIAAYAYRSRVVLSLALTALAAWMGIEQSALGDLDAPEVAVRAFASAAAVMIWWRVNRRPEFARVFEHFGAQLGFLGAFALMVEDETRVLGCVLLFTIAALVIWWGMRIRRESFVLYGFLAAVIAVDVFLIDSVTGAAGGFFIIVLSTLFAIGALFVIHARFRELTA
jgi:hypothetical protein